MDTKHAEHIAANGKVDIHGLEYESDKALKALLTEQWTNDNNRKTIIQYLDACRRGQAKSGNTFKRVGKASIYRVLGILRLLSEQWLKKDFDKATTNDWNAFYESMEDDKIKNNSGKTFKPTTKAKNYKTIKKFLKWKYGNNLSYPAFCAAWITTEPKVTKQYLTRAEVERVVAASNRLYAKAAFLMLFDGGFRVEELCNLRWSDVRKQDGKDYYQALVRSETSKTKEERVVSLTLCTDVLDSYRASEERRKDFKETDRLFPFDYAQIYGMVRHSAARVLNKKVSPHTFRHSSATHYAGIIKTYQAFCARYGWRLKSNVAERYFHRGTDDDTAGMAKEHEIARFKTEFEQLKATNAHLAEQLKGFDGFKEKLLELAKQIKEMKKRSNS